jgi:hypothetical protein
VRGLRLPLQPERPARAAEVAVAAEPRLRSTARGPAAGYHGAASGAPALLHARALRGRFSPGLAVDAHLGFTSQGAPPSPPTREYPVSTREYPVSTP